MSLVLAQDLVTDVPPLCLCAFSAYSKKTNNSLCNIYLDSFENTDGNLSIYFCTFWIVPSDSGCSTFSNVLNAFLGQYVSPLNRAHLIHEFYKFHAVKSGYSCIQKWITPLQLFLVVHQSVWVVPLFCVILRNQHSDHL